MNTLPSPIKILLADDDKDDRFFFEKALHEISNETKLTMIEDGEKLMNYLSKNQEQLPDVIFLDLNMPRKNGIECLTELKSNLKLKGIPVIIYSTSLSDEIAGELFQIGAHYYLQKCDFGDLPMCIQRVLSLLAKNRARPAREKFIVNFKEV